MNEPVDIDKADTLLEFFKRMFATDFMPHGHCFFWRPDIVWLHVISDAFIAIAYFSIPFMLIYFIRKNKNVPFHWLFKLFAAFICWCGITHIFNIITLWIPIYRADGIAKAITALISCFTATQLFRVIPGFLKMKKPEEVDRVLNLLNSRTQTILDNSHDAFIGMDSKGEVTHWNHQAEKTFGWTYAEVIGEPLASFIIPPTVRMAHYMGLKRFLETGDGPIINRRIELTALKKDGTEFPVELAVSAIKEDGEYRFFSFLHDITERKKSESDLLRSEEKFRLLVSGVKDYGIFMLDPKGIVLSWNEGAYKINGYKAEEIIGKHFSVFYSEVERVAKKPDKELEIASQTGKYEEEGFRVRKDGSTFLAHVIVTALRDVDGKLYGFGKITQDVTERKAAEDAVKLKNIELEKAFAERNALLKKTEIQLKLFVENGSSAICMLDNELNVISVSRQFLTDHQIGTDVTGKNVYELFPNVDPKFKEIHQKCLKGAIDKGEDIRASRPNREAYVSYEIRPWHKADGSIGGIIMTTIDTTERVLQRKRIEELVKQLQGQTEQLRKSNTDLSQFAYSASHDLKEPLRMISTYSQLLTKRYSAGLDKDGVDYLQLVVEGTERMSKMVDAILTYSQSGQGELNIVEVDSKKAVDDVMVSLATVIAESKVKINLGPLPKLRADEIQLGRLFQNLISNAIKFKAGSTPQIWIQGEKREHDVLFSVKDNGIGIDKHHLDKIFNVFTRLNSARNIAGTGIGLATCKRIVGRHNGRIWVESEIGIGSTFFFTIAS